MQLVEGKRGLQQTKKKKSYNWIYDELYML